MLLKELFRLLELGCVGATNGLDRLAGDLTAAAVALAAAVIVVDDATERLWFDISLSLSHFGLRLLPVSARETAY